METDSKMTLSQYNKNVQCILNVFLEYFLTRWIYLCSTVGKIFLGIKYSQPLIVLYAVFLKIFM